MTKSNKSNSEVITFGCRLNSFESQVIETMLHSENVNDTIVVNTCAVTKEAERQARQKIRKLKKEFPNKKIIVTGCSAQVSPDEWSKVTQADFIIGNEEKFDINFYKSNPNSKVVVQDIMTVKETANHMVDVFDHQTRAFVQIQNGCDHRCTFCIIPYGRGPSRSVPMGHLIDQITLLVNQGYNEIVLTGVDLTSYGEDLPGKPKLGFLLKQIFKHIPQIKRLRLSSIDSIEVDDDLLDVIAKEEKFMPHLHLSLQSGDNMILKRMKRRHLREDTIEFCTTVRKIRSDVVFGADIIAGFPTETEDMFNNSIKIIEECDLTYLHIFPYSERPGTPAAKMPQVDPKIRKKRASILREKGKKQLRSLFKKLKGRKVSILVEKDNMGRTEQFCPVKIKGDALKEGNLVEGIVSDYNNDHLIAEVI